eukprot:5907140-Alexandrium_andersonii.AAC.1
MSSSRYRASPANFQHLLATARRNARSSSDRGTVTCGFPSSHARASQVRVQVVWIGPLGRRQQVSLDALL